MRTSSEKSGAVYFPSIEKLTFIARTEQIGCPTSFKYGCQILICQTSCIGSLTVRYCFSQTTDRQFDDFRCTQERVIFEKTIILFAQRILHRELRRSFLNGRMYTGVYEEKSGNHVVRHSDYRKKLSMVNILEYFRVQSHVEQNAYVKTAATPLCKA